MIPLFIALLCLLSTLAAPAFAQGSDSELHTKLGKEATDCQDYARAVTEYKLALACVQPGHYASCLTDLGIAYEKSGEFQQAEETLKSVIAFVEKVKNVGGFKSDNHISAIDNLTRLYLESQQYAKAETNARAAIALSESIGSKTVVDSSLYNSLGEAYMGEKKYKEADAAFRNAVKIADDTVGNLHWSYARSMVHLAECLSAEGSYAEAQVDFEKSLPILAKQAGGEVNSEIARIFNNLAKVLAAQKKDTEAERLFKKALYTREEIRLISKADVLESMEDYGKFLREQRRTKDAEKLAAREEQLKLQKRLPIQSDFSYKHDILKGKEAIDAGDSEQAEKYGKEIIKLSEDFPPDDPRRVSCLVGLARFYMKQGKLAESEPSWEHSYALLKPVFGDDHPPCEENILEALALFAAKKHDYERAIALYKDATKACEEVFGQNSFEYAHSLEGQANIRYNQGLADMAVDLYKKSLAIQKKLVEQLDPEYLRFAKEPETGASTEGYNKSEKTFLFILNKLGRDSEAAEFKAANHISD